MSWIWLVVLLFFLVFFGGIFFLVNHNIQIQKKALQTIYQEQYAARMEVTRLARALDSLLADREVSDLPPVRPASANQAANLPSGMDQLLLSGQHRAASPAQQAKPSAPNSLNLKM